MTKILKLEMKGFKSFAHKVDVPFGDGFNVVLGPNGSGKSNIVDGICFVLGRLSSKSMRAEKTAELIYKGGKKKSPASQASVSIVFDNSKNTFPLETTQIAISRTVKKDGGSVYRINEKRSTRQEIIELLSHAKIDPEGYNIILQGDITKFVEMSPDERRKVIEEISGISHYEDRKHKALLELNKVDKKLHDTDIILEQRGAYLANLSEDREQAVKFRNIRDKLEKSKGTLIHLDIKQYEKNLKSSDTRQETHKKRIEELHKEIKAFKGDIESVRKEISAITQEIEEGAEEKERELFSKKENLNVEIGKKEERLNTCRQELEKLSDRKEALEQGIGSAEGNLSRSEEAVKRLKKEYESAESEVERLQAEIDSFREKHAVDDIGSIEEELSALDSELDEKREAINKLREEQQAATIKKELAQTQLNSFEEQSTKLKQVKKEHKDEVDTLKHKRTRYKELAKQLNTQLTESSSIVLRISKLQDDLAEKREELSKQRAVEAVVKDRTAASMAVKKILEQRNRIQGIHGTVSDLAQVPGKYALALEVAAGSRMNNVVVDDDGVAAECIRYLKNNKLGYATFLPLNKIKAFGIKPEAKKLADANGAIDFAVNLIQHKTEHKKVFQYVFGSTLVVDNIDVMRRIGIGATRMVSLDGDIAETSGAMTGGHRTRVKGTGFARQESGKHLRQLETEVRELTVKLAELETQKSEIQDRVDEMRVEKASLEGEIAAMEKKLHLEESDFDTDKEKKLLLEADLDQAERALQRLVGEISQGNSELAGVRRNREELKQKMRTLREPKLIAELSSFTKTRDERREHANTIIVDLRTQEQQISDILKPELEKTRKILEGIDHDSAHYEDEQRTLDGQLAENREELKKHEKKFSEFRKRYKVQFQRKDELQKKLEGLIAKHAGQEGLQHELEQRLNAESLKVAETKADLVGLEKAFELYKDMELLPKTSRKVLREDIEKYEEQMAGMGNINMKALEIYERVEREYDQLTEKRVVLHEEKGKVEGLIQEIEGQKTDLFLKTFKAISENFQRIFKELAPKGETWLLLENEESPLDGGIEIRARMSEKRILPIRALSGGEKTLTALAFIFSIQEYDPASFYVFDEVDAALDKHNSEKLGKLLGKYSQQAQYVIISHNDYVLGEADVLYGISMNKEGISKITSLQV